MFFTVFGISYCLLCLINIFINLPTYDDPKIDKKKPLHYLVLNIKFAWSYNFLRTISLLVMYMWSYTWVLLRLKNVYTMLVKHIHTYTLCTHTHLLIYFIKFAHAKAQQPDFYLFSACYNAHIFHRFWLPTCDFERAQSAMTLRVGHHYTTLQSSLYGSLASIL